MSNPVSRAKHGLLEAVNRGSNRDALLKADCLPRTEENSMSPSDRRLCASRDKAVPDEGAVVSSSSSSSSACTDCWF